MRIETTKIDYGADPGRVLSVTIIMDNGENYVLTESRTSASQCDLVIQGSGPIVVKPRAANAVDLGRTQ